MDTESIVSAVVALLVITTPFDPIKILFFNQALSNSSGNRITAALRVAGYVAVLLGGAALLARELLDLLGIDLDAFSIVGGLIIALMGFEMLYGGGTSKAQGESTRKQGPGEEDAFLIPLTLPLIAGPGAIATTISIASQGQAGEGFATALIAVGAVAVTALVSFTLLGDLVDKAKPDTVSVLARIGGLLLATIGTQMMLGGIQRFFA